MPHGMEFNAGTGEHLETMEKAERSGDMVFLLCTCGAAVMEVDMRTYEIRPRTQVILVFDTLTRVLGTTPDFQCSYISMAPDFMESMGTRLDLDLLKFLKFNPVSHHNEEYDIIINHVYELAAAVVAREGDERRRQKMHALLYFYLADISDNSSQEWAETPQPTSDRQKTLFGMFLKLVREESAVHRDVEYYADRLSITPRYLSQVCRLRQMSPKEVIDESLCFAAKEILYSTDATVQEVATDLGFADQSVFTRFFHRVTSMTPTEWRKKYRE